MIIASGIQFTFFCVKIAIKFLKMKSFNPTFTGLNQQFNSNFSSPCQCSQNVPALISRLKYKDFFYFNDRQFFTNFSPVANRVNEILEGDQWRNFRSSLPKTYYVNQKTKTTGGFVFATKTISIPNPFPYSRLMLFLQSNHQKITTILQSSSSVNANVFWHEQDCLSHHDLGLDLSAKLFNASLGFRFSVQFQLADFYNSVYTHFIANSLDKWAKIVFANDPTQSEAFADFATNLDARVRNCQFNRSKSLIKGVVGVDVCAEIFLALLDFFIDLELNAQKLNFKYVRNHDKYFFFFSSRAVAEKSLAIIQGVFLEEKLNIDFASLKKFEAPFHFPIPNFEKNFLTTLESQTQHFVLLNQIQHLQKLESIQPSSKAIANFLFLLNKKTATTDRNHYLQLLTSDDNLLVLFNLQQNRPDLTKYIVPLLSYQSLQKSTFLPKIQSQLEKEIIFDLQQQNADQEIVAQIYFADQMNIFLDPAVLGKVLSQWERVGTMVVLTVLFYVSRWVILKPNCAPLINLWNSRSDLLEKIFSTQADWLMSMHQLGSPYTMLKNISQTDLWLLLYEAVVHNWYQGQFRDLIVNDPFFSVLFTNKVSFLAFEHQNPSQSNE